MATVPPASPSSAAAFIVARTTPNLAGQYVFGDFNTSFGVPDGQIYYLA
jgi:hypothetical protein